MRTMMNPCGKMAEALRDGLAWLLFQIFGGAGGLKDGATLLRSLTVAFLQHRQEMFCGFLGTICARSWIFT
jgi:hypothetical protein